jgi:uncharacterized protein YbbC (DUF1343 family)
MMVKTGLDILRERGMPALRGRRLGVVAHPASVARDLTHLVDCLLERDLDVRVLMGPEHGVRGDAQDMEALAHHTDRRTNLPVISLYGDTPESLRPSTAVLADLDVLLIDLQDIGSRYYTFAATMRACLEASAGTNIQVMVLDRPNPLNGLTYEGPPLEDGFRSFVGAFAVPVRHGLTIGELALVAKSEGLDTDLTVVAMEGWRREMWFDETGLPWVLPSPNMATLDTAVVYPGSCLIEATNLSEGRGTTRPFELLGAPWLAPLTLSADLEAVGLPGVRFRPMTFVPTFHKYRGQPCGGVQLHIVDRTAYQSFLTGLFVLQAARRQAPDRFAWRAEPYEFVADRPALDLLTGSPQARKALETGADLRELAKQWLPYLKEYENNRRRFWLYPASVR